MSRKRVDVLLREFDVHLLSARGATLPTRREYGRYVREFLDGSWRSAKLDVTKLSARDLIEFITERAKHCSPGTAKLVATALRSFLRFLHVRGLCDVRLVAAVPVIPNWKLTRIPKTLTAVQTRALLRAFERSSATGRRDYAMTLCMVEMGLRADEVAQLALDDIDWRVGTLRVAFSKSRRESVLPLTTTVGRGLVAYLRRGRPAVAERRVFVRHRVSAGKPLTSSAVRGAIRRAFERARIAVPSKGTHVLRHTAATRMLRAGASLKDLADVLRHRSFDTTKIYTKVDLGQLKKVALPWPVR